MIFDAGEKTYLMVVSIIKLEAMSYELRTVYDVTNVYDEHDANLNNARMWGLCCGGGISVLLLISVLGFLRPLKRAVKTIGAAAAGDYTVRMPEKGSSELKTLAHSINEMTASINEREEKLRGIAESRKRFADAMAHEMKTPLGVIRGYSELMQEGIAPEKHPAYLAGIVGETERMDAMVLQILSFSRIDTRHLPVRPVCFAIDALIREQLADFQPGIEKKQLTLYLEVPEFLYVTADEKGMALVLRNLISNAVKYAPPGKAVKLRAFSEKRRVVVEVFNEGPPVAERDLPYLWDAFYRAEESRTRENGGSGMGLAIVKAVLDQHRARYGVYNKSGGVYFWFSLPS